MCVQNILLDVSSLSKGLNTNIDNVLISASLCVAKPKIVWMKPEISRYIYIYISITQVFKEISFNYEMKFIL